MEMKKYKHQRNDIEEHDKSGTIKKTDVVHHITDSNKPIYHANIIFEIQELKNRKLHRSIYNYMNTTYVDGSENDEKSYLWKRCELFAMLKMGKQKGTKLKPDQKIIITKIEKLKLISYAQ